MSTTPVPGPVTTYYWRCSVCETTEPPFFVVYMGRQLIGDACGDTMACENWQHVGRTLCQRCNEGANPSHAIPQPLQTRDPDPASRAQYYCGMCRITIEPRDLEQARETHDRGAPPIQYCMPCRVKMAYCAIPSQ